MIGIMTLLEKIIKVGVSHGIFGRYGKAREKQMIGLL
jgi:hypothetical protein